MMTLIEFLVGTLATYRLTSLLYREVGPWNLMSRIRNFFGIVHDYDEVTRKELGHPHGYPITFWGKLFECFWCLSVWVGAGVTIIIALGGTWILVPLALSGAAILCVEGVEN
jgi:hypothetical protein